MDKKSIMEHMLELEGWEKDEIILVDKASKTRTLLARDRETAVAEYNNKVRSGVCTVCGGKLFRGKKNKHNGYERTWVCTSCFAPFKLYK